MFKKAFRRRMEEKTNYGLRLALLKSGLVRAVIRKSNKHISVQFVNVGDKGDRILASAKTSELKELGWDAPMGNLPAAYLTGYLAGSRAMKAGVKKATADLGLQTSTKGSRLYSALMGAVNAGIEISHSKEILPSEERIRGEHIAAYSSWKDYKTKPSEVPKLFETVKQKIAGNSK